jgi:hypothetical protein
MSAPPVEKTASGRVQIAAPTLGIRADGCQPFGWSYADVQRLARGSVVVPVAGVTSPIAVADLLL